MSVSAQVSVYPLGQGELDPAIEAVWRAFESHGLTYRPGSMSTLLEGNSGELFAALQDAFEAASKYGGTLMVITVSNVCPPAPLPDVGTAHA